MRCNNCGWDNPDENTKCEKCNAPLQVGGGISNHYDPSLHPTISEPTPTPFGPTVRDPEDAPAPIPANQPVSGDLTGTVNPYAGLAGFTPIPRCILKPIIFPGEDTRYAPKPVNIKGDFNELNRRALDPDNNTITTKVQAILTHKNGKWYIQNQSAQKTTFVFAAEPVALKPGDIILMGNRTFVFEED